jgi:hypothetical protein
MSTLVTSFEVSPEMWSVFVAPELPSYWYSTVVLGVVILVNVPGPTADAMSVHAIASVRSRTTVMDARATRAGMTPPTRSAPTEASQPHRNAVVGLA